MYAYLVNAYLICMKSLADKTSCRRKMKAALCLSPAQRPLHVYIGTCTQASFRKVSVRKTSQACMLVCLSQIYIFYQSLNSCPKLAVAMATEHAFQNLLPALFPEQPMKSASVLMVLFQKKRLILLTTSLDCWIKPLRMMQTVLQSSVYTLRWFKLSL